MSDKPRIGFYWCGSCGGCEESIVDLAEDLLWALEAVEIVFFPVAMDFKKRDIEEIADGAVLATLVNGCIRTSEQEEMVRLLRRKSQLLVAYGSCACMGGIPGLANQFSRERILKYVYEEAISVEKEQRARPLPASRHNGRTVSLPAFHHLVRALDQVVEVDYYLPGCPPTPGLLKRALETLLSGDLPPKGAALAPDIALCEGCPRKETRPVDLKFSEFRRPHRTLLDPERCFLAQGVLCMGPATRGGCEALCIRGNMPCTGCFGPTSRVRDQGAKMLSAIASSVNAGETAEIEAILAGIVDPVGTFYRYGLARSLLRGAAPARIGITEEG
jgi:F420-non-reducing hydrogenase small subunit